MAARVRQRLRGRSRPDGGGDRGDVRGREHVSVAGSRP
jgi:hypothetical protein